MSDTILAYASVLHLTRADMKTLGIKDAYSLHRVVYGLFDDTRAETDKQSSVASGIVYANKGGDFQSRQVLMLSNRKPHQTPQFGEVRTKPIYPDFVAHDHYAFEITLNPSKRDNRTGKIIPLRGRDAIESWFIERAPKSWGFDVNPTNLQTEKTSVQIFEKAGQTITHGSATLKGELTVTDRAQFVQSVTQGIGRGRAFGFGLLQVVPLGTR